MLHEIAYKLLFGLPLIAWGGLITLSCFLFTAFISISNKRGLHVIPFKWHSKMAIVSLTLSLFHGTLGILSNIK